ncbi:hypothetical protein ACKUSY_01905 [Myroides odoratus]
MKRSQYLYFVSIISLWVGLLSGYAQTGINTKKPYGLFHIDGKSSPETTNPVDAKPTVLQQEDDFVVLATGSVGIGTIEPHASSIIDMKSDKKGVLIPRVSLSSATDINTIPNPEKGLMVYNKATVSGLNYEGFAYWNGSQWRSIDNAPLIQAQVGNLECGSAKLTPETLTAGVPYSGYLRVPYTGGNGAKYSSGSPIISSGNRGLTATLEPGTLNFGEGSIVYKITGTPEVNGSVREANFHIVFGGFACTLAVGNSYSPPFEGVRLGKIIYTDSNESGLPDPSKTVELGDLIFRLNHDSNTSNRGPQIALAKPIRSNTVFNSVTSTTFGSSTTGSKTQVSFMANETNVFKNIAAPGSSNDFNIPGVRITYIADESNNTVYKLTIAIVELRNTNSPPGITGPWKMYSLVVEQY